MSQRINSQISQSTYGTLPASGFVRQPSVLACVPFSATTLWRRCKAGSFPSPIKLSERVTAWRAEDVRQWLAAQGAQA
ncbi:helix-turn-helix transcriptional regulator [Janthinobacterium sp. B9-8]|uniref:helix-turn-helix transcriptional regulator n=1 Tax=Janthinobacterium sp. B9-8 TaxID=1236179 RepID=UPI0009EAB61A|nr:AlpA family phage regulatory protein [Janthinobacterium sp. B9-8]